jgi:AbrB family looped-hinge helix DNA binding protein
MSQNSVKTKVTEGGRIVIPAKMREALGLKKGTTVTLTLKNGSLEITTRDEAFRRIDELMKPYIKPGRSVVDELIAERRREAKNE